MGCGDDGSIDAVAGVIGSGPAIDHIAIVPFDMAEVMGVESVAGSFFEHGQGDVRLAAPLQGLAEVCDGPGDHPLALCGGEVVWQSQAAEYVEGQTGLPGQFVDLVDLLHFGPSQACGRAPATAMLSSLAGRDDLAIGTGRVHIEQGASRENSCGSRGEDVVGAVDVGDGVADASFPSSGRGRCCRRGC